MFFIMLFITLVTMYFSYDEYQKGRIGWAMFWTFFVGWDLHALLGAL
jgi:hypothetical protein